MIITMKPWIHCQYLSAFFQLQILIQETFDAHLTMKQNEIEKKIDNQELTCSLRTFLFVHKQDETS